MKIRLSPDRKDRRMMLSISNSEFYLLLSNNNEKRKPMFCGCSSHPSSSMSNVGEVTNHLFSGIKSNGNSRLYRC
jgi:hypothetical protein